MSAATAQTTGSREPVASFSTSDLPKLILRLLALGIVDVFALALAIGLANDGNMFLAVTIIVTTIGANIINLVPDLWPLRWMTPALVLVALIAIYPLLYTVYIAFTNYREGHRYTKTEAIERLQTDREYLYVPEGGSAYSWTPYVNEAGEFALWLQNKATGEIFFAYDATKAQPLRAVTAEEAADGAPDTFDDYTKSSALRFYGLVGGDDEALLLRFGDEVTPVAIKETQTAGVLETRWEYLPDENILLDKLNNVKYVPDDSTGNFVAIVVENGQRNAAAVGPDGQALQAPLGYWATVGLDNFRLLMDRIVVGGVLLRIFLWTIAFAFFSVITAFAMGLFIAIMLNRDFKGVRIVRSLLIIPYAIPGMIGILIWRGMLNPEFGVIIRTLKDGAGVNQAWDWRTDPGWAKFMVLLVNLWFAYPYFMLICSGALQSISESIYEAAEVDGATPWDKFWKLTLPLLLVSVGPLLVGSFIFNFNNFILIEALTGGGPAMRGLAPPVPGHTDNLISYTYRYAFSDSAGSGNYSFAAAIGIVIFFLVGALTLVQFRLTKRWEQVGENV